MRIRFYFSPTKKITVSSQLVEFALGTYHIHNVFRYRGPLFIYLWSSCFWDVNIRHVITTPNVRRGKRLRQTFSDLDRFIVI